MQRKVNTVIIIYLLSVFLDFQFDGELEGRLDEIIQKVLLGEDFSDHYFSAIQKKDL